MNAVSHRHKAGRRTARQRFVLAFLFVCAACAGLAGIGHFGHVHGDVEQEIADGLTDQIDALSDRLIAVLRARNYVEAATIIDLVAVAPQIGCVVLDTGAPDDALYQSDGCSASSGGSVDGDLTHPVVVDIVDRASPGAVALGRLRVWLSPAFVTASVYHTWLEALVPTMIVLVVAVLVAPVLHDRVMRRPILRLIDDYKTAEDRGGRIPVPGPASDELTHLIDVFNHTLDERDARERHLSRHGAVLGALLEASPDGLLAISGDGQILQHNRRFLEMFGVDEALAETGGAQDLSRLMLAESDCTRQCPGGATEMLQCPDVVEQDVTLPDGRVVERRTTELIGDDGHVIGRLWSYRDVTEQRETATFLAEAREWAERECRRAEEANAAKSQFLATMSHELRTPLNAILGFSEMIDIEMHGPVGDERYGEYARDIQTAGRLLLDLIGDVLEMARIDAGKRQIQVGPLQIGHVITGVARNVRPLIDEAGLSLSIAVEPPDLAITADERAIRQILLNLLSNAIKFTPAGGVVAAQAYAEAQGDCILQVTDTGVGIEESQLVRVLQPFEQAPLRSDITQAGTGLGLPIVRGLVDLHGGSIEVESSLGKGTRVTVRLPQAAGDAATDLPQAAQ